jgi:vacuolar protein sorting-associated protein 13A/C
MQSLSLVDVMIENLQLKIHNVHIRFEDKVSAPRPFACGITLDHLTVTTTDENWMPGCAVW